MNAPTAAPINPAWAQTRRDIGSFVRQPGANSAGSFRDLLAAFDPAGSSPNGLDAASPAGLAEASAEDAASPDEQDAHTAENQPGDETAEQPPGVNDDQPADETKSAGPDTVNAAQPGDQATNATSNAATPAEVIPGAAVNPDAGIGQAAAYELANAASIDLARLARDQLRADPAALETGRTPEPAAEPRQPGKPETLPAHQPKAEASPNAGPKWTESSEPPPAGDPGRTPPTVASAGSDRAASPDAFARSSGAEPIPAPTDTRRSNQPIASSQAGQGAVQAQAITQHAKSEAAAVAINRTALLERLTASAETGRGAVAALDRVGQQPLGREAERANPNAPTPDAARQTREAVLNTVQRGLASVLSQGGGRMTVVLRPERLGEVRVRMETNDGVVNARLSATTDAARHTLESGLDSLRAALEARGVRVESLLIDPAPQPAESRAAEQKAAQDAAHRPEHRRQLRPNPRRQRRPAWPRHGTPRPRAATRRPVRQPDHRRRPRPPAHRHLDRTRPRRHRLTHHARPPAAFRHRSHNDEFNLRIPDLPAHQHHRAERVQRADQR